MLTLKIMKLAPLFDLIRDLEGHDVDKMSDVNASSFCSMALDKFRVVSAPIPGILLGPHIADGYDWHVEPSQFFPGDYVGSLKLVHTGKIEAAIGEPEKLRMAAALFPDAAFEVALFCDFHCVGGLQSLPRLEISLSTDGREHLARMVTQLGRVGPALAEALAGPGVLDTRIVATECACDEVENPADITVAFEAVAAAAMKAAREPVYGYGDDQVTERVEIRVGVGANHDRVATTAECILKALGSVFVGMRERQQ